jgi:phosphatidylserine/phosphatidylglycerophosphate/cardiolipin synthase-like enzyme
VRLLLSRRNDKSSVEKLLAFCKALSGNDVRLLNPRSGLNLSSKLLIVDERVSLVASANWTESAVSRSRQVGVMIDSPDVAKYYRQIFDVDWRAGLIPDETPDDNLAQ